MTILDPRRTFLEYALSIGALEFIPSEGRKLKSGRMSPYFFNSALFTSGDSIHALMAAYGHCWHVNDIEESLKPDIIFGPAYKGIPLSYALTMQIGSPDVSYTFNRKEVKDHGEGGITVGANMKGKRVLIVDDVITSGKATREAIEIIEQQGGIVIGCLICFNRQEKGKDTEFSAIQELEKEFDIHVYSAVSFADLFPLIQMEGSEYQHMLPLLEAYREKYGINVEENK